MSTHAWSDDDAAQVLQIVTHPPSVGDGHEYMALTTVVFVEKAGILLRSGACPSFSRELRRTRLRIFLHTSALSQFCVDHTFFSGPDVKLLHSFSLWPGSHQLKYFFSFTDPSSYSSPNDARSVGSVLPDVLHIRPARRHSATSWEGRSQAIGLPGCRTDTLSPGCSSQTFDPFPC